MAKAVAWANAGFPGSTWSAEIAGYDFYYKLTGKKYVLFTTTVPAGWRTIVGPMVPPEK